MGLQELTQNVGGIEDQSVRNVGALEDQSVRVNARPPDRTATNNCVLVVIIDDIGPEYFTAFSGLDIGVVQARTPRLTAAALAGVSYTNAEASPICGPTRAQIQTMRFGQRTGMGTNVQFASPDFAVPNSEVFIAEAVRNARGYDEVAAQSLVLRGIFGKWHLTHPDGHDTHARDNGWNRGHIRTANAGNNPAAGDLDHYVWRRVTWTGPSATPVVAQIGNPADFVDEDVAIVGPNTTYDTDTNWNAGEDARALVTWANTQSTRPLLLVWAPNPPHDAAGAFQCPPFAYLSATTQTELGGLGIRQGEKFTVVAEPVKARACFLAAMEAVDTMFGYILDNLSSNITTRLATIVTGDNGTVGEMCEAPFSAQRGKRTVFRQGCIVPFFVHGPMVGAPGRTCAHPVQSIDIGRTVMDIMGCNEDYAGLGSRTIDSISFFPSIRSADAPAARTEFWQHTFGPNVEGQTYPPTGMEFERIALRETVWTYMEVYALTPSPTRTVTFYDRIGDPFETVNLNDGDVPTNIAAEIARMQAKVAARLATP